MKYLIAVQFIIIVCFSTYVSNSLLSIQFVSPGPRVIDRILKLSPGEFLSRCFDLQLFDAIDSEGYLATQMAYALANVMVSKANNFKEMNENHWNELIDSQCLKSAGVKGHINDIVVQVSSCLMTNRPLAATKKSRLLTGLFKGYCAAVLKLAKEKYAAGRQ